MDARKKLKKAFLKAIFSNRTKFARALFSTKTAGYLHCVLILQSESEPNDIGVRNRLKYKTR